MSEILKNNEGMIMEYESFIVLFKEVWCTNLNVDDVSNDDNYFVMGGDSIRGIKLLASIKKEFLVELDYMDVFENQEFGVLANTVYDRYKQAVSEQ